MRYMIVKINILSSPFVVLSIVLLSLTSSAATITYTYDNLNRLTKADYGNGVTEQYTYDAAGNRLTLVATGNQQFPLSVIKIGMGGTVPGPTGHGSTTVGTSSGTVTSSPPGISCGSTCRAAFDQGTSVMLSATATSGSMFSGWNGEGCSGTGTCTVSMTQARQVTATFAAQQFVLTVVQAGTGRGTVTSSPAGINCGSTCSAPLDSGSSVTLIAMAARGSTFAGWSGEGCGGTGACTVSITQARSVIATFTVAVHRGFNGAGRSDILWRHTSGTLSMWFMNGTSVSGMGLLGSVSTDWQIVGVGDFNGDGKDDILWRHPSGALDIWFMDGASKSGEGSLGTVSTDWQIVGVGDFNGDGKADILWQHTSGTLSVWLMNGTHVSGTGSLDSLSPDWQIAGVGDFNGDGKADILWQHTSGLVYIWLMDGTRVSETGSPGSASSDWQSVDVGDFDGDGKADILWWHPSGLVYVWLMNGTRVSGTGSPGSASSDWHIVGVGDFNGDGKDDILWRHTAGALSIWFMDGTRTVGTGSPGSVSTDWHIR